MKLNAYSVYDNKALQYHPPFFASADGSALRSFSDLANDPNTNVGRHPSDFVLYRVGTWEDGNGKISAESPLAHIADASAVVRVTTDLFAQHKDGETINLTNGSL